MLKQILKRRLGVSAKQGSRLVHLILLAVSMMTFSVLALIVASSLFLSHVGVAYLPLSYMLMGLVSLPAYTWLSQVVDRYSRVGLCKILLLGSITLTAGLRLLLELDAAWVYYALHVGAYFQWILVPEVLFPSLVSDYFTTLDWKRYGPLLKMAMAVGGLLGGGLTTLLAVQWSPENMVLSLLPLYGIVFAQLVYLEMRQSPLEVSPSVGDSKGKIATQSLVELLGQYPIIFFLASSTFLYILLYSIAEFEYLGIYARSFPDSQGLTRMLGLMRVANNILPFFILYFFTGPAIARWGVSRMNLVYPLTTLASFAGLAANFNLPAAVLTNLNADGLDDSLNQPIHNLNYNAVPYQILGQVRAISNGLVYSVGLAVSGGLLWLSKAFFSPLQIVYFALGLSVVFAIARYFMGKSYLRSLLALLRSGVVDLEQVGEGFTRLPRQYRSQIQSLLKSEDRHQQNLGLELAGRTEQPQQFLPEIEPLLSGDGLDRSILKFFRHSGNGEITGYLRRQLTSTNPRVQRRVLTALIAQKQRLGDEELRDLLQTSNPTLKAIAYIALQESRSSDAELKAQYGLFWFSNLDAEAATATIEAIRSTGDRQYIPLLQDAMAGATANIKRQILEVLASLARSEDSPLAKLAAKELTHLDPLVRAAAFKLLGKTRNPDLLPQVAQGLEHPNLAVRLEAAQALATYGESCLPFAEKLLNSPRLEVVEVAIAAIGQVQTRRAETLLFDYLKPDYRLVRPSLRWLQHIPRRSPLWQPLNIALADFHDRLIHRVLYVLSNLDREGTSSTIRRILNTQDERLRANAIETLASGRYRRFVTPILPLVEGQNRPYSPTKLSPAEAQSLLEEAIAASDHWIRIGAILARDNYPLPQEIVAHPDLLLQAVLEIQAAPSVFDPNADPEFFPRVIFLKTLPLLKYLFLDELLLVNRTLHRKTFAAGEKICSEGTFHPGLHIVLQGQVALIRALQPQPVPSLVGNETQKMLAEEESVRCPQEICLSRGQYFGAMTLLDESALTFSAIARSDCTVLTLAKGEFANLTNRYPRLLMGFSQATQFF